MKKNILALALIIFLSVNAFAQNGMTKFEQLPATAQEFVKTYFKDYNIQYIFCDKEFADVDYKIRFEDGTEIEFNSFHLERNHRLCRDISQRHVYH